MDISVNLLHYTPLEIAINAIRMCYQSFDKSDSSWRTPLSFQSGSFEPATFHLGPKDEALLYQIVSSGHESTIEHLSLNFEVDGISRLCLQELARHRIASYSVKSTRYTLKELKDAKSFVYVNPQKFATEYDWESASKYLNLLGIPEIDLISVRALEELRKLVCINKYSIDQLKYSLPENYKTDLIMTFNLRSLRNFLRLRLNKRAHFEIRDLANKVYNSCPEEYKFLLQDVYENT